MSDAPSDLERHLGYWLRLVSNAVSQAFARAIEAESVNVAEWVFLRMLFDGQRLAPSHLATRMGMTKGAISKLSDRLGEKRLIERVDNPADGRAHVLALTDDGRTLVPRLAALADANDHVFFGALPPEDQAHLRRILGTLAQAKGLTLAPLS